MEVILLAAVAVALVVVLVKALRKPAGPGVPPAEPTGTPRGGPPGPTVDAPVPRFRVVALGPSGSGKTVLLSSMFHELSYFSPRRSYWLETNPRDLLLLNSLHAEVSDTTRPWPRATGRSVEETKEFQFRCVGRGPDGKHHTVAQISYLDFAGVLVEDPAHGTSASFAKLHEAIAQASALLVLIDGRRVRQLLEGAREGHRHFANTLKPTLAFAQSVSCPVHLVLTKWDLVQEVPSLRGVDEAARLSTVVDELMRYDHVRALVDMQNTGQTVRIIPVSSVGRGFVELDGDGRVVKRPMAALRPSNVDAPLAAVVPDFFRQVQATLDTGTRRAVSAALRKPTRTGTGELVVALSGLAAGPVGVVLRNVLIGFVGGYGDALYTMFLDYLARDTTARGTAATALHQEAERQIAGIRAMQARLLQDFSRVVQRLEDDYPRSLLAGVTWQATP